jgi:hypothetical protein
MTDIKVQREVFLRIDLKEMKSPREPGSVAEIHGSAEIIQTRVQLLCTHIPQGAPSKGVVKAQALQIFRREEYIHKDPGAQDFINGFG